MRQRTPSEIKAYGDGYAEAYKQFCHLLDRHDKEKAVRMMKIFADAVALTVETATDTADNPQTESLEQFRVGLEYHTDATHFGKAKGESTTTNTTDTPQTDCAWR